MDSKVIYRLLSLVALFFSTQSFAVEFQGKFIQGHYIIGKTEPGSSIFVDKKKVKVTKDGYFAFGIEKDRKFDITITENNNKIVKKIKFFLVITNTNYLYIFSSRPGQSQGLLYKHSC